MPHIVVATDLSASSEPAVERATLVSRTMPADLRLLHVLPELMLPVLGDFRRERAQHNLLETTRRLSRDTGWRVSYKVMHGDAARCIARESENLLPVLTVIGHRSAGSRRRRLTGTVAERSIRDIQGATLIVRDQLPGDTAYRKALLAAHDEAETGTMMRYLRHLAPEAGLHRLDRPAGDGRRRSSRLNSDFLGAMRRAVDADLLAIGLPRGADENPFRFRSVLGPLLREAECDVLVVPPGCAAVPAEAPERELVRAAS